MRKATLLTVLLCLLSVAGFAQSKKIAGMIKAARSGDPIPGVAVIEKGTQNGVVSNNEGKFEITVSKPNAVLVFSSLGMKAKEMTVGSEDFLIVTMEDDSEQLDEVVVTALGISREKKTLGYAVTNLGSDDIQRSGEQNVIQSLAAKAPGVQVISSSGTPGASSKILIRGNSTFGAENQPLIVVDGVPIDNTTTQSNPRDNPFNPNLSGVNNANRAIDINPDDIESVTVLKGPAAAALYGARAGNGAIIYTTKRGKLGKKGLGVKVSSSVELSQVNKLPERQRKYVAGTGGNYIAPADAGPDGIHGTGDDLAFGTQQSWGPSLDTFDIPVYDNEDAFFQTGVSYNNNIEVTGGTDNSTFRLGIGDVRQNGIVPNTNFNRTSIRLTADTRLSKKVKVGATANYIRSSGTMAQNGSNLAGVMLGLMRAPISFDLSNYMNDQGFQNTYFFIYDNPYYTANENPFTSTVNRFLGNAYVNYDISDNWSASYRIGTDAYVDNRKQIYAISSYGDDIGTVGQINENRLVSRQIYGDLLVNYTRKINDSWNTKLTMGHNFFITEFDDMFGRGRQLTVPNFYNLSNATDLYASQTQSRLKTSAFFGELNVDFKNQLFLTFTGRNEWASSFEVDEKNSFFYPSAQASYVFTELFDELPSWLAFGKLRYSYAVAGVPPQPYGTRTYYNVPIYTDGFTNGLTFPYGGVNGSSIGASLGQRELKPERVIGNEFGLNVILWNGLIDVDVTYYNQKSVDILLNRPIATSSGYEAVYSNSGEMVNRGVELDIEAKPIRKENFSWTIGLNWYMNRSEVLKLAEGVDEVDIEAAFASIGSFAIVGEPYGVFYGTRWARDASGNLLIGANGLPRLDPETGNLGNPQPDWMAGLRNTFTYKEWTLSFLFDFRQGGQIWNGTWARLNQYGITKETEDRERTFVIEGVYAPGTVVNGVDVSGQANSTEVSALSYYRTFRGDAGAYATENAVEEVNWVRLRDLSLSYHWDLKDRNWGIQFLDFRFTGRNLWLSTNYNGVDPETSLTGAGSNVGGFDYFNMPGTKSYLFGVSFGF